VWAAVIEHSVYERMAAAAEREGTLHLLGRPDVRKGAIPAQCFNQMAGNGASNTKAAYYRTVVVAVDLAGLAQHGLIVNSAHPMADASSGRQHPVSLQSVCLQGADELVHSFFSLPEFLQE